jgi:hypothetical protein
VVGLLLAKEHAAKWVATWNDPYPRDRYPSPYSKTLTSRLGYSRGRLLREIVRYAAWHVFPCERLRDYFASYLPGDITKKSSIIPHIIAETEVLSLRQPQNRQMTLVHAGDLNPPRASEEFVKGLSLFVRRESVTPDSVRVHLFGAIPRSLLGLIDQCGVRSYCEIHGSTDYATACSWISSADVGLLIEADFAEGIFLPSKLADYLQYYRPVMAIGPRNGTMSDLISRYGGGVFADCRSPQEIARGLKTLYRSWLEGRLNEECSVRELRDRFTESKAMVAFGELVAAVMAERPSVGVYGPHKVIAASIRPTDDSRKW